MKLVEIKNIRKGQFYHDNYYYYLVEKVNKSSILLTKFCDGNTSLTYKTTEDKIKKLAFVGTNNINYYTIGLNDNRSIHQIDRKKRF